MSDCLLPEEIILEILSRSLAESVYQCALVCKTWRNLIYNDKSFAQMHSRQIYCRYSGYVVSSGKASFIHLYHSAEEIPLLKHVEYDEDNYKKPLKFEIIDLIPPSNSSKTVGSCNGLICISLISAQDIDDPIYICNPFTKEYVYLPKLKVNHSNLTDYVVSGFGYHPCTNEYKVVRIYYCRKQLFHTSKPSFVGRVQVYNLGSGNGWRNKEDITYELLRSVSTEILADGALHWFDKQGNIVAFDLADEKFHILPKPRIMSEMWNRQHLEGDRYFELRVLGGCLCIIDRMSGKTRYPIWSFKKRNDLLKKSIDNKKRILEHENNAKQEENYKLSWSWIEDLSFDWEALNCYKQTRSTYPLAILKDGTRILYHDGRCSYLRQDLGGHNYQHIAKVHIPCDQMQYMKSFVSLKALGEKEAKIIERSEGAKELPMSE